MRTLNQRWRPLFEIELQVRILRNYMYGSSLILMLRLCRSFPVSSDFASSVDKTISDVYELH